MSFIDTWNYLCFEVITKWPISQHFEKCVVIHIKTNFLNPTQSKLHANLQTSRSHCFPPARKHFWEFATRVTPVNSWPWGNWPRNCALNWFIPAFANRIVFSPGGGRIGEEGTNLCSRLFTKKSIKVFRTFWLGQFCLLNCQIHVTLISHKNHTLSVILELNAIRDFFFLTNNIRCHKVPCDQTWNFVCNLSWNQQYFFWILNLFLWSWKKNNNFFVFARPINFIWVVITGFLNALTFSLFFFCSCLKCFPSKHFQFFKNFAFVKF